MAGLSHRATKRAPWLVVYDNVESESAITDYVPVEEGIHVLVTSRSTSWTEKFKDLSPRKLPCERPDDAGPQLLMQEAKRTDDRDGALVLAREVDGYPLALVVAGSLARSRHFSFRDIARDIDRITSTAEGTDYKVSLNAAVQLSYDRLGADARWVLDLFAWWAPEGLAGQLLTDVPKGNRIEGAKDDIPDDLMALCRDPMRVRGALAELASVSLISGSEKTGYALHRMAAAAVRQVQGDRNAATSCAAAAVLAESYPIGTKPQESENWPECKRLTPHVRALLRTWPVLSDLPPIAAETVDQMLANADVRSADLRGSAAAGYLFNQASVYMGHMADYSAAVALAEASLRLTRARLSDEARQISAVWSTLGNAYIDLGQPAAAVAAQRECLRLSDAPGFGPEDRAKARTNLAVALHAIRAQAAWKEALELQKAARAICEEAFGPESPQVGQALLNIAASQAALGDLQAAIGTAERVVPLLSKDDPGYGFLLTNLGAALLYAGRTVEARERLDGVLSHRCEIYGREDHPEVIVTVSWLVSAHLILGRRDPRAVQEARELADRFGLDWDVEQRKAEQYPDPQ